MKRNDFGIVVLIGERNIQLESLRQIFREYNGTECICFHQASKSIEQMAKMNRIDVVVADWLSLDLDVFEFLEQYAALSNHPNGRFILCGPGNRLNFRASLLSKGVDYYMIKPYKPEMLLERLEDLRPERQRLEQITIWDALIFRELEGMRTSPVDVSYAYMGSCLQCWLSSKDIPQMQRIFMEVGQQHQISAKGVESSVNRAIRAWARAEKLEKSPTCKEWFAATAEKIRLAYEGKGQEQQNGEQRQDV